jgi:type I restriction enzyme, S subunit
MSDWEEYRLDEIIEKFIDYRGKTPKKVTSGIPLITAKVIKDGTILPTDEFIESDEYSSWMTRGLPKVNDVLLTTEAPLGEVAIVNDANIALAQRIILLRGKPDLVDNGFLFYSLRTGLMQHRLSARASGSTVQGIKSAELKKILIPIPDVDTQKQIVSTLSCLDHKIENLRKQNETLERIAQTLFQHWFVDFEFPNDEGKPYKSSGGEMMRSELGEIPMGWRVGNLKDLFTLNYGKSLTLDNRVTGQYPVVGSSGVIGSHQDYFVDAPGIVIGRKGTIGQVIWLEEKFYPIDTTFYIEDIFGCNGLYFYYLLLKRQNFQRLTSDSAVPGLNRDMAYGIEIAIPKVKNIDKFNTGVKAVFDKKNFNYRQIETLSKTRDVLLPKLMSGQLCITKGGS